MAFNPFLPFKGYYINRLKTLDRKFIVSQTYQAAGGIKTLLFTDYALEAEARKHFSAIGDDPLKAIIYLDNPVHCQKVFAVTRAGSGYKVFWGVIENTKKLRVMLNGKYGDRIRKYVEQKTQWYISRDAILKTSVELLYGRLLITLHYQKQDIKLTFEELEKL